MLSLFNRRAATPTLVLLALLPMPIEAASTAPGRPLDLAKAAAIPGDRVADSGGSVILHSGAAASPWLVPHDRRGWLQRALAREAARTADARAVAGAASAALQHTGSQRRSWMSRHPILAGAAIGFGGGFLIGYVSGDDGAFYDFTAGFNGVLVGAIGAGTGAAVGAVADALR